MLKNDSYTPFNTVLSIVHVCICYALFKDKTEESFDNYSKISPVSLSHVIQYLSAGYKRKGNFIIIWWNNSGGAYLPLENDSHTPNNTVSSIVNWCIRFAIF